MQRGASVDYSFCELCPNLCRVDRTGGQVGRCGQTNEIKVAWSGLHRGEEPPITGEHGSGMVFFCGCPLHCQYCQNYQISQAGWDGVTLTEQELSTLMLELQAFGAASINLVTGTHYIPSIASAIRDAKARGLTLPIVWNSSGYESVEALKLVDPLIDLYLLDVKTLDHKVASEFCGLSRYADAIVPVMKFLKRRHPSTDLENGLKGTLVRHLVFPGCLDATVDFLHWYADNFKDCTLLSLMVQFVPPKDDPGFSKMTKEEYNMLLDLVDRLGIDGFVQEMDENEILWIPDFRRDQPFPESFADPLPYFLDIKNSTLL
ncbi:MAG: radical SAM protein [Spirochaetales bacterium]|nr:radical SAM protein [Spirochaetales bacterium]